MDIIFRFFISSKNPIILKTLVGVFTINNFTNHIRFFLFFFCFFFDFFFIRSTPRYILFNVRRSIRSFVNSLTKFTHFLYPIPLPPHSTIRDQQSTYSTPSLGRPNPFNIFFSPHSTPPSSKKEDLNLHLQLPKLAF